MTPCVSLFHFPRAARAAFCAAALISSAVTHGSPARAQSAYLAGSGGKFGTLNLATGAYNGLGNSSVTLNGLGFVGATLYGLRDTGTNLGTVNTATGAYTSLGTITGLGGSALFSLAVVNGTLYGVNNSATSVLYTINPSSLVATAVGSVGSGLSFDGIAAGPGGTLYGGFDISSTNNGFASINPQTGVATRLPTNPAGLTGFAYATAYANSTMYAVLSDGKIGTVNLTTGAYSATGNSLLTGTTGTPFALAAFPSGSAAPEPGVFALLSLGLVGSGVAVRRRR